MNKNQRLVHQATVSLPLPFETGPPLTAPHQLSEKERLITAYEAQDATVVLRQNTASTVHVPAAQTLNRQTSAAILPPPTSPFSSGRSSYTSSAAEKEALGRRFEAQAGAAAANSWQAVTSSQTPPRSNSDSAPSPRLFRTDLLPPPAAAGSGSG
ncbi:hypothetical protein M378DRAFT_17226 [Amanita muscaria Koide BX008]|uniref:Uncharacterized protein n=1 Tax=Amanita muscaria (strain Koide BX008) TaxID=946122 RepID=A0A0C2W573_AMAMK|nr:hypothetical protein M378DRAFT_17226 [Amanita muscaria Koide BX008]